MELGLCSIGMTLITAYSLLKLVSFFTFYCNGLRTGFPVYASPVFSRSPVWLFLGPTLQPLFKRYLPESIYERLDIAMPGWEFRREGKMPRRMGKAFVLVTPDECTLWVADPALGNDILRRKNDFLQSPIAKRFLGMFGPNVIQDNGEAWQRQRRIIAPQLNDRISEPVWKESCRQAHDMLDYLVKNPGGWTLGGLRRIATNVLISAAYGQSQDWLPDNHQKSADEPQDGRAAYLRTITLVTDRLLEAVFLPTRLMKMPFMPPSLQALGRHKENMPRYTKQVLDEERKAAKKKAKPRKNILSMLVRFVDEQKVSGSPGLSMTDNEISGNLFVLSTAGFETTAHTMGYAVICLAAYPGLQEWIREELQTLDSDVLQWKYEEIFAKCPRTLALMFETLRHFTPVLHLTRSITEQQQVNYFTGARLLSPPMDVFVSAKSIHSDPDIWGADVLDFRPSRWIDHDGRIITPRKDTFVPWSAGPRVCPGMKMSQVEFVATIATLMRLASCEPVQTGCDDQAKLQERLRNLMKNSVLRLTMQVRDPQEIQLRWTPLAHAPSVQNGPLAPP